MGRGKREKEKEKKITRTFSYDVVKLKYLLKSLLSMHSYRRVHFRSCNSSFFSTTFSTAERCCFNGVNVYLCTKAFSLMVDGLSRLFKKGHSISYSGATRLASEKSLQFYTNLTFPQSFFRRFFILCSFFSLFLFIFASFLVLLSTKN